MATKQYTSSERQKILGDHAKWRYNEAGGSYADLSGADLSRANLSGADLFGADLYRANLSGADLFGIKCKNATVFTGLYSHMAMPIIAEDGNEYVRLGCHFRKVSEWQGNFWNNDSEFPNDGSAKSQMRLMAYNTCLEWLRIQRESAAKGGKP